MVMSDNETIKFPGENTDVHWKKSLCIHIGECGRAKGDLFVGGRQPWCQPDLSSQEEVEDVVRRCPSGALSYHHKDGDSSEQASPENTVHITYNGPLYFKGDLAIEGAPDDTPGLAFRAALCRCGLSKNKPFCDNSHVDAGFQDYGAVGDTGSLLDDVGGKLNVVSVQDGPLLVTGNLTIVSGSGRKAWQGTKAALCRCGASENKPFCDGSHKKIEFKS